jgi:hypothetical protein
MLGIDGDGRWRWRWRGGDPPKMVFLRKFLCVGFGGGGDGGGDFRSLSCLRGGADGLFMR